MSQVLDSGKFSVRWEDTEKQEKPTNLNLADYPETVQAQILAKVEAFERFINLNAIALGLLHLLALEFPSQVCPISPDGFALFPSMATPVSGLYNWLYNITLKGVFSKVRLLYFCLNSSPLSLTLCPLGIPQP